MARTLQVIMPDPETHRTALYDLMGKSFGTYWGSLDYCRNGYIEESHYDWNTSRIGIIDEEIVSHLGVWDYRMRIGADSVRTGGIGAVMTDRRFRKRGYMKETIDSGLEALSAARYGFAILFGIPDFYHRFGFVSAWRSSTVTIAERDLPDPANKVRLRKEEYGADRTFHTVANRINSGLTGTAIRPTYRRNRRPDEWTCYRWQAGSQPGYIVVEHDNDACALVDCGGKPENILSACTQLIRRRGCISLTIRDLHLRHPLFSALRDIRYTRTEENNPTGGPMIRLVNLQVAIESIEKTLMRRLRESSFAGWTGAFTIQYEREQVVLVFDRRGLKIHSQEEAREKGIRDRKHRIRGGEEIAQLLIGADDPYRILELPGIRTSGDAKGVVCSLFPEQFPSLGHWDRM